MENYRLAWVLPKLVVSKRHFYYWQNFSHKNGVPIKIHLAYSMSLPKTYIKAINQVNFNYIWKKGTHYIRERAMVREYEEGGFKAIDTDFINSTIKINWLRSFLKNENRVWFHIPNKILMKSGGIKLSLDVIMTLKKLPVKLSAFHELLLYWKMIFRHNFRPCNTPLWKSRYMLLRNKSLFYKNWLDKGIWSMMYISDDTGNIMPFKFFCLKFMLNNRKQYDAVVKANPQFNYDVL